MMIRHASRMTALFALAATSIASAAPADSSVDQLGWMAGCWRGIGAEAGTGEQWMSVGGGSLLGMSRTVRGGKTTSHEFMRIAEAADGGIAFFAQPAGKPPASFAAIRISASEVVFENLAHDFPQRVIYRLEAPDRINASIEGTRGGVSRTIPYPLERAACPGEPAKVATAR